MTLAVVQSKFQKFSFTTPSIVLTSTPTVGNTIYLFTYHALGAGKAINTTNYTIESTNGPGGATNTQYLLSRVVQVGDTTTMPQVHNDGAGQITYIMAIEISGNPGIENIVKSTATSAPISGPTTASNNVLGLLASAAGSGFGSYTAGSGWTNDQNEASGSTTMDHIALPTSGTSMTTSPSWSAGGTTGHWMSVALKIALVSYTLPFAQGSYSVTGSTIALKAARKIGVTAGQYLLTGSSVALRKGLTLTFSPGSYTYTGSTIAFARSRKLVWSTGEYLLLGSDITLTPSFSLKASFAEFNDEAFMDWGSGDFQSYMAISQSDDSVDVKEQTPYIYTFLKETEDSDEDSEGATLTGFWDWANDTSSPRVSPPMEIYKFRDGFLVSATKHKMRGRGRQLQLRFDSESGKNFNLLGWAVFYLHNAKQ